MKYYSEITKKLYDDETSLFDAESEIKAQEVKKEELKKQRADRAKEVEEAFKTAYELRDKFVKDYGSFHYTYRNENGKSFFDFFNDFFLN